MCSFCAVFAGIPHWTESGTDAGEAEPVTGGREWRLQRLKRVGLINRLLRFYGCKLEDWMAESYMVRSLQGRTEIVPALPQVWQAIEAISKKPADPLDPALLTFLREAYEQKPERAP